MGNSGDNLNFERNKPKDPRRATLILAVGLLIAALLIAVFKYG
jgi:hypothetical protein